MCVANFNSVSILGLVLAERERTRGEEKRRDENGILRRHREASRDLVHQVARQVHGQERPARHTARVPRLHTRHGQLQDTELHAFARPRRLRAQRELAVHQQVAPAHQDVRHDHAPLLGAALYRGRLQVLRLRLNSSALSSSSSSSPSSSLSA